jgi:hypothetical protein
VKRPMIWIRERRCTTRRDEVVLRLANCKTGRSLEKQVVRAKDKIYHHGKCLESTLGQIRYDNHAVLELPGMAYFGCSTNAAPIPAGLGRELQQPLQYAHSSARQSKAAAVRLLAMFGSSLTSPTWLRFPRTWKSRILVLCWLRHDP